MSPPVLRHQTDKLCRCTVGLARAAGVDARKRDFVASIKGTLWYEVAVYALRFLVVFLLPNVGGHHLRQAGGAAA